MLQRIQSIFLLLTSIAFFLLFTVNFASSDKTFEGVFSDQIYNIMDSPILIGLTVIGGVLAIINIFMFNNRPLQLRLGYLLITLCILLPLVALLLVINENGPRLSSDEVDDSLGIYLPVVGLIATVIANRFINKDNKLVKSMDRLR